MKMASCIECGLIYQVEKKAALQVFTALSGILALGATKGRVEVLVGGLALLLVAHVVESRQPACGRCGGELLEHQVVASAS